MVFITFKVKFTLFRELMIGNNLSDLATEYLLGTIKVLVDDDRESSFKLGVVPTVRHKAIGLPTVADESSHVIQTSIHTIDLIKFRLNVLNHDTGPVHDLAFSPSLLELTPVHHAHQTRGRQDLISWA